MQKPNRTLLNKYNLTRNIFPHISYNAQHLLDITAVRLSFLKSKLTI